MTISSALPPTSAREPRRGVPAIRARTSALLACALALTACTGDDRPRPQATGPVDVVVPAPSEPRVQAACRRLTTALPASLGEGLPRRPVIGDPDRAAAWGDPAITLVCGSGPSGVSGIDGAQFAIGLPGSTCVGPDPDPALCLSFLQKDDGAANLFTTYERAVNARVRVPDAYDATVLRVMLEALVTLPAT